MELKFALVEKRDDVPAADLTSLNARIHDLLDEWVMGAIEALTALDLPAASRAWNSLMWHVEAHQAAECDLIICRYDANGCGGPDCTGMMPVFETEHERLHEMMEQCQREIELISAAPDHKRRRCMVDRLEIFIRVRRMLEHHALKEQTHIYPKLDATLSAEERAAVADELEFASL